MVGVGWDKGFLAEIEEEVVVEELKVLVEADLVVVVLVLCGRDEEGIVDGGSAVEEVTRGRLRGCNMYRLYSSASDGETEGERSCKTRSSSGGGGWSFGPGIAVVDENEKDFVGDPRSGGNNLGNVFRLLGCVPEPQYCCC